MDDEDYVLYNEGDIRKGLNGSVTKVLLALNELNGTLFENIVAVHTGLPVGFVRQAIWHLGEAGFLSDDGPVGRSAQEDQQNFNELLADL
jgi:hypothetical protein